MIPSPHEQVVTMLNNADDESACTLDTLLPFVYEELRRMAARRLRQEHGPTTLSTTELVHEAYLRLAQGGTVTSRGQAYFFAAAAQAMRRIVVEHARRRHRLKRGGGGHAVTLDHAANLNDDDASDVLEIDEALEQLALIAPRAARVVECRFYGGLTVAETALAVGVTTRTIDRDWLFARAWLHDFLRSAPADGSR